MAGSDLRVCWPKDWETAHPGKLEKSSVCGYGYPGGAIITLWCVGVL